jgi:hypothetical protein
VRRVTQWRGQAQTYSAHRRLTCTLYVVGRKQFGLRRNGGPVRGASSAPPAAAAGVEVAVVVRGRACGGVVRRAQPSHSVPHPLVCRWAAVAGGCAQVRCLRVHRLRCLLSSSSRSTSSTHVRFSHDIHPPAPDTTLMAHSWPAILPSSANLPSLVPLSSQDQERVVNAEELRSTKETYRCAAR